MLKIHIYYFQDDHIGIIKINMSLKQVVDRWAAFVQVRKFQKEIVVSSILPQTIFKNDGFSLIYVLASKKWSNPKNKGFLLSYIIAPVIK